MFLVWITAALLSTVTIGAVSPIDHAYCVEIMEREISWRKICHLQCILDEDRHLPRKECQQLCAKSCALRISVETELYLMITGEK